MDDSLESANRYYERLKSGAFDPYRNYPKYQIGLAAVAILFGFLTAKNGLWGAFAVTLVTYAVAALAAWIWISSGPAWTGWDPTVVIDVDRPGGIVQHQGSFPVTFPLRIALGFIALFLFLALVAGQNERRLLMWMHGGPITDAMYDSDPIKRAVLADRARDHPIAGAILYPLRGAATAAVVLIGPFILFAISAGDGLAIVVATLWASAHRRAVNAEAIRARRKRRRALSRIEDEEDEIESRSRRAERGLKRHPIEDLEDFDDRITEPQAGGVAGILGGVFASALHRSRERKTAADVRASKERIEEVGGLYSAARRVKEEKKKLVLADADLATVDQDVEIMRADKAARLAQKQHLAAAFTPRVSGKEKAQLTTAPAVMLGEQAHDGEPYLLYDSARAQHVYVIGESGAGKSTLFVNLAIQDIGRDAGVAFIDPHGDAAHRLLAYVPPARIEDVIYIEPTTYPIAFNILRQRLQSADDLLSAIFRVLPESEGPRMAHVLRECVLTLRATPTPYTLADIPTLISNNRFRAKVLAELEGTAANERRAFWRDVFPDYPKNVGHPILHTFSAFLESGSPLRAILTQRENKLDFDAIMDGGKVLIVNLGKLAPTHKTLLGALLVTGITDAAIRRAGTEESTRRPFYLICDEFQKFQVSAFDEILSEARKFRLSLTLGHQYRDQVAAGIQHSVDANARTHIVYRVSPDDAARTAKLIGLQFRVPSREHSCRWCGERGPGTHTHPSAEEIRHLAKHHAYIRHGVEEWPRLLKCYPLPAPPTDADELRQEIIAWCRKQYGGTLTAPADDPTLKSEDDFLYEEPRDTSPLSDAVETGPPRPGRAKARGGKKTPRG